MNTTNTLKEYYIKIFDLYNNCVNMITSLNQSLSTSSPQVSLNIIDSDGNVTETKIPSFIYLDNKLDEIKNSFITSLIFQVVVTHGLRIIQTCINSI